jgi:hypothetical protein
MKRILVFVLVILLTGCISSPNEVQNILDKMESCLYDECSYQEGELLSNYLTYLEDQKGADFSIEGFALEAQFDASSFAKTIFITYKKSDDGYSGLSYLDDLYQINSVLLEELALLREDQKYSVYITMEIEENGNVFTYKYEYVYNYKANDGTVATLLKIDLGHNEETLENASSYVFPAINDIISYSNQAYNVIVKVELSSYSSLSIIVNPNTYRVVMSQVNGSTASEEFLEQQIEEVLDDDYMYVLDIY